MFSTERESSSRSSFRDQVLRRHSQHLQQREQEGEETAEDIRLSQETRSDISRNTREITNEGYDDRGENHGEVFNNPVRDSDISALSDGPPMYTQLFPRGYIPDSTVNQDAPPSYSTIAGFM